jgi:hypothetical protein
MEPDTKTVALSAEQVTELMQKLSKMRHDVNNNLTLIISAGELLRRKPELAERMSATISDQSGKIEAALRHFSADTEQLLGILKR